MTNILNMKECGYNQKILSEIKLTTLEEL